MNTKPYRVGFLFAGLLAAAPVSVGAQTAPPAPASPPAPAAPAVSAPEPLAVLPFTLENNHIILLLHLTQAGPGEKYRVPKETAPFRMILDTGAEISGLAEEAFSTRHILLPPKEKDNNAQITGTGNGPAVEARFVTGVEMEAGEMSIGEGFAFLVVPFGILHKQFGVDGLLGAEVFRAAVVEVDYAKKTVRIFAPKTYVPPAPGSGFVSLPLQFVGTRKRPIVAVEVTPFGFAKTTAHLLLDTGEEGTITFASPFVKRNRWEAIAPQMVQSGGGGINGVSQERTGRLKQIQLAGISLARPYADFSFNTRGALAESDRDGLLGGEILKRFTVIFDYSRSTLYLRPNADYAAPFPYRYYGISFGLPVNGGWPVLDIVKNSPADKAGIKKGEGVFAVDKQPIGKMSRDALGELLSSGTGPRTLTIGDANGKNRREVRILPITL